MPSLTPTTTSATAALRSRLHRAPGGNDGTPGPSTFADLMNPADGAEDGARPRPRAKAPQSSDAPRPAPARRADQTDSGAAPPPKDAAEPDTKEGIAPDTAAAPADQPAAATSAGDGNGGEATASADMTEDGVATEPPVATIMSAPVETPSPVAVAVVAATTVERPAEAEQAPTVPAEAEIGDVTAAADKPAKAAEAKAELATEPAAEAADVRTAPAKAPAAGSDKPPEKAEETAKVAPPPAPEARDDKPAAKAAPHRAAEAAEPTAATKPADAPPPPPSAVPASSQPAATGNAAPAAPEVSPSAVTPSTPIHIEGVAVEIAVRAQGGNHRFAIRLDPPELGRIDVRLDIDHKGNVTPHLVVEKSQTLDLLRRDAPQLQQALQDSGLNAGELQLSLRDPGHGRPQRDPDDFAGSNRVVVPEDNMPAIDTARGYGRLNGRPGGLDIRV